MNEGQGKGRRLRRANSRWQKFCKWSRFNQIAWQTQNQFIHEKNNLPVGKISRRLVCKKWLVAKKKNIFLLNGTIEKKMYLAESYFWTSDDSFLATSPISEAKNKPCCHLFPRIATLDSTDHTVVNLGSITTKVTWAFSSQKGWITITMNTYILQSFVLAWTHHKDSKIEVQCSASIICASCH